MHSSIAFLNNSRQFCCTFANKLLSSPVAWLRFIFFFRTLKQSHTCIYSRNYCSTLVRLAFFFILIFFGAWTRVTSSSVIYAIFSLSLLFVAVLIGRMAFSDDNARNGDGNLDLIISKEYDEVYQRHCLMQALGSAQTPTKYEKKERKKTLGKTWTCDARCECIKFAVL